MRHIYIYTIYVDIEVRTFILDDFFISPPACSEQYIKNAVCFQLSVHSEALLDAVLPAVVDHAWTFIYGAALRPSNDAYPNVRGTDQFGGE